GAENPAAAELVGLYEAGRDFVRAAHQCRLAARNAAAVFAHHEAGVLAHRGLRLLDHLAPSPERDEQELGLRVLLGMQLQMTEGFASAEIYEVYHRASELCERSPGTASLFPLLWGLWLFHKVRSHLGRAAELAQELRALAARLTDP